MLQINKRIRKIFKYYVKSLINSIYSSSILSVLFSKNKQWKQNNRDQKHTPPLQPCTMFGAGVPLNTYTINSMPIHNIFIDAFSIIASISLRVDQNTHYLSIYALISQGGLLQLIGGYCVETDRLSNLRPTK